MLGKMLLRRIERSRRYAVDPPAVKTLCAYLLLREKIIKPLLAGTARPRGRPPKVHTTLDQHYVALREELSRTFQPYWGSWGVVLSGRIGGLGCYGNRSERVGRSPVG